jgi:class 3 adenylate cyclase
MAVVDRPETRFAATSDGAQVAYQVVGDGPVDLLVNRLLQFPIDLMWDEPRLAGFLDRLSTFSRHIWFDPRGAGSSDRIPLSEHRLAEDVVEDMVAVLDDLSCERVALLGLGVPIPLLFAATHPERTSAIVLVNTHVRHRRADDYPVGLSDEELDALLSRRVGWLAPSLETDQRFRAWLSGAMRLTVSPTEAARRQRYTLEGDLRATLPAIHAPTLVLFRQGLAGTGRHRYVAEQIDAARLVEVPGNDELFFAGDTQPVLDAIEEFLTGKLPAVDADRVLSTVLFTDVVASTEHAARLGDRRWKDLLTSHDAIVRAELDRYRGNHIKSVGDGVLATFDGPGRAIRCAGAIRESLRSLGIDARAGLHTGEIELRGADVGGIAVHIAARVASQANPGEVLVSRTVVDLVVGSDIEFEDRGEHKLRGVPGFWRLFAVKTDAHS